MMSSRRLRYGQGFTYRVVRGPIWSEVFLTILCPGQIPSLTTLSGPGAVLIYFGRGSLHSRSILYCFSQPRNSYYLFVVFVNLKFYLSENISIWFWFFRGAHHVNYALNGEKHSKASNSKIELFRKNTKLAQIRLWIINHVIINDCNFYDSYSMTIV